MKKTHLEFRQSLKNKTILIIGSNSTLAKEFFKIIDNTKFNIIKVNRKYLNFNENYNSLKLRKILDRFKPDFILNFIGKFSVNKSANRNILFSNILPTWEIIKYFQFKKVKKKINIIILGSSSYKSSRKKYILYAASKSGLNSLCKSAKEFFLKTNVSIKIYNPSTFGGKHLGNYVKKSNTDVNLVAKKIYKYINRNSN